MGYCPFKAPLCMCFVYVSAKKTHQGEKKKNRGLCSNHKTQYVFLSTSCLDYVGCCILKLYWREGSWPVQFYCMLTNLLHTPAACGTFGFHSAKTNWPWEPVASQNQMTQLDKCATDISAESVCDSQWYQEVGLFLKLILMLHHATPWRKSHARICITVYSW